MSEESTQKEELIPKITASTEERKQKETEWLQMAAQANPVCNQASPSSFCLVNAIRYNQLSVDTRLLCSDNPDNILYATYAYKGFHYLERHTPLEGDQRRGGFNEKGWKLHISVPLDRIEETWDLTEPLLKAYRIKLSKVMQKEHLSTFEKSSSQRGKVITVYCFLQKNSPKYWKEFISDVTRTLNAHHIPPGPFPGDEEKRFWSPEIEDPCDEIAIEGTNYVSYRDDSNKGSDHPFLSEEGTHFHIGPNTDISETLRMRGTPPLLVRPPTDPHEPASFSPGAATPEISEGTSHSDLMPQASIGGSSARASHLPPPSHVSSSSYREIRKQRENSSSSPGQNTRSIDPLSAEVGARSNLEEQEDDKKTFVESEKTKCSSKCNCTVL